jgi:hypothetical protein
MKRSIGIAHPAVLAHSGTVGLTGGTNAQCSIPARAPRSAGDGAPASIQALIFGDVSVGQGRLLVRHRGDVLVGSREDGEKQAFAAPGPADDGAGGAAEPQRFRRVDAQAGLLLLRAMTAYTVLGEKRFDVAEIVDGARRRDRGDGGGEQEGEASDDEKRHGGYGEGGGPGARRWSGTRWREWRGRQGVIRVVTPCTSGIWEGESEERG